MVLSEKEISLIEHLELQIIALEREWFNYEKEFFHDLNKIFNSMPPKEIKKKLLTRVEFDNLEKLEFKKLWNNTITLFRRTADYLTKGKKQQITILNHEINFLKQKIINLEAIETKTLSFFENKRTELESFFDSVYGEGFYERLYRNYDKRFKILHILQREYELISSLINQEY